jgi:glycosyltransferase involved in cell wall biosynthesis
MTMDKKVIIVMPAYNAAKTLEQTYRDIPRDVVSNIILVDDVSRDETVEIAKNLGLQVLIHIQNRGYGGNQKTCYVEALKEGADVIVMLHPDNQYDSRLIPELITPIIRGEADIVLGSRILGGTARQGGMPIWKYVSNRFLTIVENLVLGHHLSEYHTGFRAFNRKVLSTVPFLLNSDGFVFDTEILIEAMLHKAIISEIPIPTRYFPEASSVNFWTSTQYGLSILWTLFQYILFKLQLVRVMKFQVQLKDIISSYHRAEIIPGI